MAVSKVFDHVEFISAKDAVKLALPLVVIIGALCFDELVPAVYPDGYVETYYPIFLRIVLVVYLVAAVLSVWFEPVRRRVVHLWGLLIVFFAAVTLYTYNTVKTGNLTLPIMPSPDAILGAFFATVAKPMWQHFCGSLSLLLQGVGCGFLAGMIYGTLMGYSKFWNYWLQPFIKVVGPVPSTAWMAIAMVLAPSSHLASVFLVALSTWFPLSVNLSGGIRGINKTYVEKAEIMGASKLRIITTIIYPSALPNMFTGLFMGLCFSMTALVNAEMLGVQSGLGWVINYAKGWNEFDLIFCTIIIFIIMAFVLLTVLFKVQKHVMKWTKGAIEW